MNTEAHDGVARSIDVVALDYHGVCTPSTREFIDAVEQPLDPLRPELGSAIAALRSRGITVALLSNEFDRSWCSDVEDFPTFDHVMVGTDNRIFKPDRRAFQRVVHVTGCEPERLLVVDDDPLNVQAAEAIGCCAVWFDVLDVADSWRRVLSVP